MRPFDNIGEAFENGQCVVYVICCFANASARLCHFFDCCFRENPTKRLINEQTTWHLIRISCDAVTDLPGPETGLKT
jgi:hypothetical protein